MRRRKFLRNAHYLLQIPNSRGTIAPCDRVVDVFACQRSHGSFVEAKVLRSGPNRTEMIVQDGGGEKKFVPVLHVHGKVDGQKFFHRLLRQRSSNFRIPGVELFQQTECIRRHPFLNRVLDHLRGDLRVLLGGHRGQTLLEHQLSLSCLSRIGISFRDPPAGGLRLLTQIAQHCRCPRPVEAVQRKFGVARAYHRQHVRADRSIELLRKRARPRSDLGFGRELRAYQIIDGSLEKRNGRFLVIFANESARPRERERSVFRKPQSLCIRCNLLGYMETPFFSFRNGLFVDRCQSGRDLCRHLSSHGPCNHEYQNDRE